MKRHMTTVHEGQKPYQCETCLNRFTDKRSLQRHIGNIHGDNYQKPTCSICQEAFTQKSDLEKRMATHHKINTIKRKRCTCQICDESFSFKNDLQNHVETCHQIPKATFTARYDSSPEMDTSESNVQTTEKPVHNMKSNVNEDIVYECRLCQMIFPNDGSLLTHNNSSTHKKNLSKKKPYCGICVTYFETNSGLDQHLSTRHGIERVAFNNPEEKTTGGNSLKISPVKIKIVKSEAKILKIKCEPDINEALESTSFVDTNNVQVGASVKEEFDPEDPLGI